MESKTSRLIARLAWIIPVALLALSLQQFKAARDLGTTLREGEAAVAQVLRYDRTDRKDVTHAEVDLFVRLADGSELRHDRLALPYSIAHRIDEADSVDVRVIPGAAQEIVIASIGGTQRGIALSNGAMAIVAFLMALAGVIGWNRYVSRERDASAA